MKIRALSVFEGVVYHCWAVDTIHPCRPTLEVDAVLRSGDADNGPLLLSVAEYAVMVGGSEVARPCLDALAAKGRIVSHLGVDHIAFPFWTPVSIEVPGAATPEDDGDDPELERASTTMEAPKATSGWDRSAAPEQGR